MKVTLLEHTPNPDLVVAVAAKQCYSSKTATEIINKGLDEKEISNFVQKLFRIGHESPFEHVSFTFGVDGVSRTLTHQLVRHRIASYSQKSQRYVSEARFQYVTPTSIKSNKEAEEEYEKCMRSINHTYEKLIFLGILKEDARYALPNSCTTDIVITMNARALLNFFKLRCCTRAQAEIRQMAYLMLGEVKKVAPNIFGFAGASCEVLGYCPEGKMSCGRYPTLENIKK